MASGLVLTYQTSGIFNFAHGAVAFTTAFFYYQLHTGQGIPIVPAAILSVLVFAPLLGLAARPRSCSDGWRRRRSTPASSARSACSSRCPTSRSGSSRRSATTCSASTSRRSPTPRRSGRPRARHRSRPLARVPPVRLLGLSRSTSTPISSPCSSRPRSRPSLLWYVIRRTRVGLEMRAVVDRETLAALRGVNQARTSQIAWILTMVLAGLGGILITPLFQLNDTTLHAGRARVARWPCAASAGLRSHSRRVRRRPAARRRPEPGRGLQATTSSRASSTSSSGLRSAIPFILTLLVLFFVGRDRGRAAGSVADEAPPPDHRAGLPRVAPPAPWVARRRSRSLGFALQWIDVAWLQADKYEQAQIAARARRRDHLPVVRRRHRPRRHGQPRPGDVRRRRRLRRRVGAQPRLGHRHPRARAARPAQLRVSRRSIGALRAAVARRARRDPGPTARRRSRSRSSRSRSRSSPTSSRSTTTRSPRARSGGRSAPPSLDVDGSARLAAQHRRPRQRQVSTSPNPASRSSCCWCCSGSSRC